MAGRPAEQGFTLAEIIAAVVIMLVLVGIMVPSLTTSRAFPPSQQAVVSAQTLSEAVWAFQRDREGRVPTPGSAADWSWTNGPLGYDGKPYTGNAARTAYRDESVEICVAAVDAPQAPAGHECGTVVRPPGGVYARVVYTPRNGSTAGAVDGFRIDVYARRRPGDPFTTSDRKCSITHMSTSFPSSSERDTC